MPITAEQSENSAGELKKFNAYKDSHKAAGEFIVLHQFPEKVNRLNALVTEGGAFDYANMADCVKEIELPTPEQLCNGDVKCESTKVDIDEQAQAKRPRKEVSSTRVYGFVSGRVPCNEKLLRLIDMIKPILRQAIEDMNQVKVWILLLIPRMEDGNNFGVSIQEEVLGEVRQSEAEVATLLDQTSRYLLTRGKLVTKLARYPHVDDYRRAITDLDEKQFINLRLTITEVRNHYATLHDLISKNLEKIKTPRTSHAIESMY